MEIVIDIDTDGNLHCMYTDEIDLFSVGRVTEVHKVSNVEFNETKQVWEVLSLEGEVLHENTNRQKAIDWEIVAFSPNGPYHDG